MTDDPVDVARQNLVRMMERCCPTLTVAGRHGLETAITQLVITIIREVMKDLKPRATDV